ncbi:MAG: PASTA domain-containing protein [Gammaproteobacteria bacterium]|nr:PASTA domain-containing protein [Gammaproteobacteria bacterium]
MPTARSATQRVFSAGTTLFALLISLLALTGCGFATLDQMLVERGPAAELRSGGEVEVIREGKAIPAEVGMILKKEDVIQTGAGTSAAIGFMLAGEIILRPETRIKILNPSIFEFFGEIFIRVKGAFDIHTEYATAASEGTEYVVKVGRGDRVTVTVLAGQVRLSSNTNAWSPLRLEARQRAGLDGAARPGTEPVSQQSFNATIDWINRVQSITHREAVRLIVPDLEGMTQTRAVEVLRGAQLLPGQVRKRLTGSAPVGTVLGQQPASNSRVPLNSQVDLELEAEPTEVPRLKGVSEQQALKRLQRRRLTPGTISRVLIGGKVGTVAYQDPPAGAVVMVDSAVNMSIVAESAQVPALQGLSLDAARSRILSSGLRVGTLSHRISGDVAVGEVVSQQPFPGMLVFSGSEVSLVIEADSVLVPSLIGNSQEQAVNALRAMRLGIGRIDTLRSPQQRAGTVLSQSPAQGARVAPGTPVNLTVAAEAVSVPDLVRNHLNNASQLLQSQRLRLGQVTRRLSGGYSEGTILEQYPRAGEQVDPGASVSLVVAEAGVLVPNVTNAHINSAGPTLSNTGLSYSANYTATDRYSEGTVMHQSLAAGTLVKKGAVIYLTVAKRQPTCTVPAVLGDYQQALQTLRGSGFNARTNGDTSASAWVQSQYPSAGAQAPCGSTVVLTTIQKPQIEQQPAGVYKPVLPGKIFEILVPKPAPVIK